MAKIKHYMEGCPPIPGGIGLWIKGDLLMGQERFKFWAKIFSTGSKYGIDGGSISKLEIRDADGSTVMAYDREWMVKPKTAKVKELLEYMKDKYNNRGRKQ